MENKPAPINPFGANQPLRGKPFQAPHKKTAPSSRPVDPIREALIASSETSADRRIQTGSTTPFSTAPSRAIECHRCGHTHDISPHSASTVCPRCGASVSLRDYTINEEWIHDIDTRGKVFVGSQGHVREVTVRSATLTVEGQFEGAVECDGDFIIRRHGQIPGPVHCNRLIIDQGSEVEFLHPVHAAEVIIDGKVSGDIICKGLLSLKERAILIGDIQIASLAISEGARHSGLVHTINP